MRKRPSSPAPRLVLFDLDGTLVDSVGDLSAAANATLADLDRPAVSVEDVRRFVGNGIDALVHRCLTGSMDRPAPATDFTEARARFMSHYESCNARHSTLYAGVEEGLRALGRRGLQLGCVTNKSARFSEPLLAHFDLLERFCTVVSGDTTPRRKPAPEPLLHAASAVGVTTASTLMVGDSRHDVAAARAAGMPVVAVSYGYNHGEPIGGANPDAVVDSLEEIDELLAGW